MLQIGFNVGNDGVKDASFRFVENVLTELALQGSLELLFEQNFDRWTQSTLFMDVFAQRVMNSSAFTNPVANFVKRGMDDTVDKWHFFANEETARATTKIDASTTPLLWNSSSSDDYRIAAQKSKHRAQSRLP